MLPSDMECLSKYARPTRQYSRQFLRDVRGVLPETCPIICTSKGIETGTLALMHDILKDYYYQY